MTPEEAQRLQACLQEIAAILYKNTDPAQLTSLEGIETTVRSSDARACKSQHRPFFIEQITQTHQGKPRQVKSCLGVLNLKSKQAERLGLRPRTQLSPLLEKCCLRSLCQRILPECRDRILLPSLG